MMDSLEIPSFWSGEDDGKGIFPHDLLPKEGLDDLLDDLTSDLLFKPTDGDFEDWLDLKMDFSILDCMEDQNNALNEPMVMEKDHETGLDLSKMEKQPVLDVSNYHLSTYTPPSSPEGQVPDVSRPINIVRISDDRNMFPSDQSCTPPESPCRSLIFSGDCFSTTTTAVSPVNYLQVVIHEPKPREQVAKVPEFAVTASPPQVVFVSRQGDDVMPASKRLHPYSRPNRKIPPSSVLKSVVKSTGSSSRSPSVKKERKRVQNKDAATRYRQKKRVEAVTLDDQEGALKEENQKLQVKVQQLSTEVSYLKGLMKEMFRARGILK